LDEEIKAWIKENFPNGLPSEPALVKTPDDVKR